MTKKIETVIIGTSLTEMSDSVVMGGLQVARAAAAKVVLVHVFQPRMAYGGDTPFMAEIVLVEALEAERKLVERRLEEQIDRLGIRGEELAGRMVEQGSPHRILIGIAEDLDADLLVVGSAESPRLAKMLGSTADRVIRKSSRPVLVVHGRLKVPCQKVLLPVDLSAVSAVAFRRGLALLDQIAAGPDVQLEALYVLDDADPGLFEQAAPVDENEAEAASRELDRFVVLNAFPSERRVVTRVLPGEVEEAIRSRAEDWGADLVVLGTHGRGGFERFLLGSVAADVMHRSTMSTLVMPAAVEAEEPKPLLAREVLEEAAA
jgi:nucleotide-binding universal stress UspA family protein